MQSVEAEHKCGDGTQVDARTRGPKQRNCQCPQDWSQQVPCDSVTVFRMIPAGPSRPRPTTTSKLEPQLLHSPHTVKNSESAQIEILENLHID